MNKYFHLRIWLKLPNSSDLFLYMFLGATVILACRDTDKGKKTIEFLEKTTKSKNLRLMQLDLASFKSVRQFVKTFLERK